MTKYCLACTSSIHLGCILTDSRSLAPPSPFCIKRSVLQIHHQIWVWVMAPGTRRAEESLVANGYGGRPFVVNPGRFP